MSKLARGFVSAAAALAAGLVWWTAATSGQSSALPSTKNGEWTHYTADVRGIEVFAARSDQRRQLQQARSRVAVQDRQPRHASRVQARRHAAGDQGRPLHDRGHAPLGRRARRPDRRADLDPQLSRRQPRRDRAAPAVRPRRLVLDRRQRRRPHPLCDARLSPDRAQRARTARIDPDVRQGRRRRSEERRRLRQRQPIDLETGEIGLHATPTVVKDVVIVGSSFKEGTQVVTHNNTKGLVRAFDVRTGKLLWTFNTIPRPGEFGNDTWENDSWADQRQHRRLDADHGR